MTEDIETLLETDDPSKVVVHLHEVRHKDHGRRKEQTKPGKGQPEKFKRAMREVLSEENAKRAAELTPEEEEFVQLFVNGISVSEAYRLCFPERCFKEKNRSGERALDKKGEPIPLNNDQLWDRGSNLVGSLRIKSRLRQIIEQNNDDVSHTSLFLSSFVQKRYMWEAIHGSPASRLKALERLQEYAEVAKRDQERAQNMDGTEDVRDMLDRELTKLGV